MAHVLLYDGVCGLCNRLVRAVLARDPAGAFAFAPLQSERAREALAAHGREPATALDTVVVLADVGTPAERVLVRGDAVAFVARELGYRRTARLLERLPRAVLDLGYRLVARHRDRVFGRYEACPLPPAEHRTRFLDD